MFKHAVQNLAIALLFAASVIPVVHGFKPHSMPSGNRHVVIAVEDVPTPTEPHAVHVILAFLGLA